MSMTVVVARNLPERFGGFLSSCMLKVAPGLYVSPQMRASVRERIWTLMERWMSLVPADGGIAVLWRDRDAPSGLGLRVIGWPKTEIVEQEGMWLSVGDLTTQHDLDELKLLADTDKRTWHRST